MAQYFCQPQESDIGQEPSDLGYLIVDNEPCKRCGPPGVPVHEVKWRKN